MGRVAAKNFAEAGARVVLLGRSLEKLDGIVKDLEISNDKSLTLSVDVSDSKSTIEAASAVLEKFGKIEILLNLVGGWIGGKSVFEVESDEIDNMVRQHIDSSFLMLKAFGPSMVKEGWGRILGISSPNATRPGRNIAPYAIGKAGMEALYLSLAEELRGSGVTVNIVKVNTIDVKHERLNNPSKKNANWTTPEEISATLLHLSSEEAGMINGARIPLYGKA
jgi:NAD(P)-dependent dehydrogenase (short-subunit alcohol dehydrogenase family)